MAVPWGSLTDAKNVDAIIDFGPGRAVREKMRVLIRAAGLTQLPDMNSTLLSKICRNKDQALFHFLYKHYFLSEAFRPSEESARGERSAWPLFSRGFLRTLEY